MIAILLVGLGVIALILGTVIITHREITYREIDDVHQEIPCSEKFVDDSTWIWVIPLYHDVPIQGELVEKLKKSGKKIGMHGVRHTLSEFATDVSKDYIKRGMDAFERAFGYRPKYFKAPKLKISQNNIQLIKELDMIPYNSWQSMIHKVYHCEDYGRPGQHRLKYELDLAFDKNFPVEEKLEKNKEI